MLPTIKMINYLFLCVKAQQIHLKVTKILRICPKKFCEFQPSFQNIQRKSRNVKTCCQWLDNLSSNLFTERIFVSTGGIVCSICYVARFAL